MNQIDSDARATANRLLRPCPSCRTAVSKQAAACPKCGHHFQREWSSHSPIVIFGALALMYLLVFCLKIF